MCTPDSQQLQVSPGDHFRILDLPNELISSILAAGCSAPREPPVFRYALAVSQTSRKLREVALNTPLLWSNLDVSWPSQIKVNFLERSKSEKLSITYNDILKINYDRFASMIPLSHRWSSLYLELPMTRQHSIALDLAALTDVHLSTVGSRSQIPQLISKWAVPSLSHLTTISAFVPFDWFRALKSFEFILPKKTLSSHKVGYFASALQNALQLEKLTIRIHDDDILIANIDQLKGAVTTFVNLREIKLFVHPCRSSLWIATLFSSIRAPNISSFALDLLVPHRSPFQNAFHIGYQGPRDIQPIYASVLSPETLELRISCQDAISETCHARECDEAVAFWTDGATISSSRLKSLIIKGKHIAFSWPNEHFWQFIPQSIQSLRFIDCVKLPLDKIHELTKGLGWHKSEEDDIQVESKGEKVLQFKNCLLSIDDDTRLNLLRDDLGDKLRLSE